MSGEAVSEAELKTLFEAARWAPSTNNEQEWRFCYARRETPHWETFLGCLVEANQAWAKRAGALAFLFSRTTFTRHGKPNPVHQLDAGAALQNLQLQAVISGLASHAMAGIDRHGVIDQLRVPDGFDVHCGIAIGRSASPTVLSEKHAKAEVPSGRKALEQIVREGPFTFDE